MVNNYSELLCISYLQNRLKITSPQPPALYVNPFFTFICDMMVLYKKYVMYNS